MRPGQPFIERVTASELAGGGRLAVLANPHAPTVTIAGTLRAGPALATDGRFSVPGLTAAMLERGTAEHGRMELARELEDHGLQLARRSSTSCASRFWGAWSASGRKPTPSPMPP